MKVLVQYAAVAAGGSLGAMARFAVARVSGRLFGSSFPTGTFIINITGSLLLGWFIAMARQRTNISETMTLAVAVGFVGAYTTFSTYMLESNALLEDGAAIKAMGNLIGSIIVGLLDAYGRWLLPEFSYFVLFGPMAILLLFRATGIFGKEH